MIQVDYDTLRSLVYVALGDAYSQNVPSGLVDNAMTRAMEALSQLAVQVNPECLIGYDYSKVFAGHDIVDIPERVKAISTVHLVAEGEEPIFVHKISQAVALAAETHGGGYWWHYVDSRRVRLIKPDGTPDEDVSPGLRFSGVMRLILPRGQKVELLPDGGDEFIRYWCARALYNAPGANVDPQAVKDLFTEARESVMRSMAFFDAAAPGPIPEAAP